MGIQRIHSLDYLRGIMACAVMIYHYSFWTYGVFDSSTVLGRLGTYGVSCFYILSGLTLFTVYKDSLNTPQSVILFGAKRFFRIYPLLWVVTLIYIVSSRITDPILIGLNITGLFGFIQPDAYIGTGVWSIGNELVFYSLFPFLIFFRRMSRFLFHISILIVFSAAIYFAFFIIDSQYSLQDQWSVYVNPFNQFYLFTGGVLIGHLTDGGGTSLKPFLAYSMILGLILLFCFYPASGDLVSIVTDWPRVVFSLICFALCFVFHVSTLEINGGFHKVFSFLGATSYSIYLLHPIVYQVVKRAADLVKINAEWSLPISVLGTLMASFLSYQYLEKSMIQFGSKVINRIKSGSFSS